MIFNVRFATGKRLAAGSRYSLREICTLIVERYSLTEREICTIATLPPGEKFANEDMQIARIK